MGIDLIRGGRIANRGLRQTKTTNTYIKTLIKLYAFLTRRTDSKFNRAIHKRLNQSRLNRYPISISRIARTLQRDQGGVVASEGGKGLVGKVAAGISSSVLGFFKSNSTKQAESNAKPTQYNSRIVAVVGTVTNDNRFLTIPQGMQICALKFTTQVRTRIQQAGGRCITFDQLAQIAPTGKGVLLLRGPRDREAKRHFGLYPGQKGSHTAPRVSNEGRKWERARGRR